MKKSRMEPFTTIFALLILTLLFAARPCFADIYYSDGGTYNFNTTLPAGTVWLGGGTTANIYSSGNITGAITNNGFAWGISSSSSQINMYGGTITGGTGGFVDGIDLSGGSQINMYGGTITGGSGGFADGILTSNSGTMNIYGGSITGGSGGFTNGIFAEYNTGPVNIYGGTITAGSGFFGVDASYNSLVNIHGGNITAGSGGFGSVTSDYSSTVNIYGGNINGFIEVLYGGTVDIFGSGFNYGYGQVNSPYINLTGTLSDGTPINVALENVEGNLILSPSPTPIPSAAYLFGSGLLGLIGIRKKIRK